MGKDRLTGFLSEVSKGEKKILALLADNSSEFNLSNHQKLVELGLVNTKNFIKEEKANKALNEMEIVLKKDGFLMDVRKMLGKDVQIIEYKKLVSFCNEYNLLFGKAGLFRGTIPKNIMESIVEFNFNRITNFNIAKTVSTVANFYTGDKTTEEIFVIAAPINFNGNKGFISNCEVISSDIHPEIVGLEDNSYRDAMIVSPVVYEDDLYFVIIKVW